MASPKASRSFPKAAKSISNDWRKTTASVVDLLKEKPAGRSHFGSPAVGLSFKCLMVFFRCFLGGLFGVS